MAAERPFIWNFRPWRDMHNWRHNSILPGILVLSMASSSCLFKKNAVTFTPPPARPAPSVSSKPAELAGPPLIEGDPAASFPEASNSIPEIPEPPPPKPAPRRPVVATAPPKPATTTAPPETPGPRIAQLFTPDQQREYNRSLDESLERVKHALLIVSGKSLTAEQNEIANKIRTFQKQAEEAREQDLLTAVTLAKRADVLAQDLLERLP